MPAVTAPMWAAARALRTEMQRCFQWKGDEATARVPEFWSQPKALVDGRLVGDCEDHAIHAYHRLREAGWPRAALRLAIASTGTGERGERDHALLLLDTDVGLFAFDNRARGLPLARELGYRHWLAQQPGKPITDPWVPLTP